MNRLTEIDFLDASLIIGCEIATIKAVAEVESNGGGFLANGKPKILFEGHWFYKFTKGRFGNTWISYPKWITRFYNSDQHKRLEDAMLKDRDSALKSASWECSK